MHEPATKIFVNKRLISISHPTYFIAEIGSNFDGELSRAKDLIWMAKEAGAEAAKFQHYTASSLVSDYGFKSLGAAQSHQAAWKKSVSDTYNDASLRTDWTSALKKECDKAGLTFFSSAYSKELIDEIDPFVPAYKVGSGDITWLDIADFIAKKNKPVFLATGASNLAEVKQAADTILQSNPELILMQCNTNYTATSDNFRFINLNVLKTYSNFYPGVTLGLSDHTPGHSTVLGAVTLGARVIEKHFTDSTGREGPDHKFSMTPITFKEMVECTRELEASLGDGNKVIEENELETVVVQRRCIRAKREIRAGETITEEIIEMLRPCPEDGVPPYKLSDLIGKVTKETIKAGEHIRLNSVAKR